MSLTLTFDLWTLESVVEFWCSFPETLNELICFSSLSKMKPKTVLSCLICPLWILLSCKRLLFFFPNKLHHIFFLPEVFTYDGFQLSSVCGRKLFILVLPVLQRRPRHQRPSGLCLSSFTFSINLRNTFLQNIVKYHYTKDCGFFGQ